MVHFRFFWKKSTNSTNFFLELSQKTSLSNSLYARDETYWIFLFCFISFWVIFCSEFNQHFVWICFGLDQLKSSYFGIKWTHAARRRCHGSRAMFLGYIAIRHIRRGWNYYLLFYRRFHWKETSTLVGCCSSWSKSIRSFLYGSLKRTDYAFIVKQRVRKQPKFSLTWLVVVENYSIKISLIYRYFR